MMDRIGLKALVASALLGVLAAIYVGVAAVKPSCASSVGMWLPFGIVATGLTLYTIRRLDAVHRGLS